MNATAEKFGYPESLVAQFEHWLVLVRPAQPTLGSLVLVCTDPVGNFGQISADASRELQLAVAAIERVLGDAFAFDKINYLMLMMVDPDVHFHVLPRYSAEKQFAGQAFADATWPGPPDITAANAFSDELKAQLTADLKARFAS